MPYSEWLDKDEYPDDDDLGDFGYDSVPDDDPLTIGDVGDERPFLWTAGRIIVLAIVLLLVLALLAPGMLSLLR